MSPYTFYLGTPKANYYKFCYYKITKKWYHLQNLVVPYTCLVGTACNQPNYYDSSQN